MLETWVDWSKYQGRVGAARIALMTDVAGVCVGSWHGLDANPYCHDDLADARTLGKTTGTYIVLNAMNGRESVQRGQAACGNEWEHLNYVALDVEIYATNLLTDLFVALEEVIRLEQRPLIYTGNWFWSWWTARIGCDPDVRQYPMWIAYYNGKRDLSVPSLTNYGPIVAHQFAGTTPAYDTQVDFNVFSSAWIQVERKEEMPAVIVLKASTPPPGDPNMESRWILQDGLYKVPLTIAALQAIVASQPTAFAMADIPWEVIRDIPSPPEASSVDADAVAKAVLRRLAMLCDQLGT